MNPQELPFNPARGEALDEDRRNVIKIAGAVVIALTAVLSLIVLIVNLGGSSETSIPAAPVTVAPRWTREPKPARIQANPTPQVQIPAEDSNA